MGEIASTTQLVPSHGAAIGTSVKHLDRVRQQEGRSPTCDTCPDSLAGNSARHQHDPPIMTGYHPPAHGGTLYVEFDEVKRRVGHGSKTIVGSLRRRRNKQPTAASRALS